MEWNEMKMEWEDCMKIDGFVKYASRKFSDTVRSHVHAWITAIVFDCGNEWMNEWMIKSVEIAEIGEYGWRKGNKGVWADVHDQQDKEKWWSFHN